MAQSALSQTGVLAPFSLGRRVGDEGKLSIDSAMPGYQITIELALANRKPDTHAILVSVALSFAESC